MDLYSFFNSSTSYRVRIALALKGLDAAYHGVDIRAGKQYETGYVQMNPNAGVPLLVDGDFQLGQSLAISLAACVAVWAALIIPALLHARFGKRVRHERL